MPTSWSKESIAPILERCGTIALTHYAQPQRSRKKDGSFVTNADREIEAFMTAQLHRPDDGCFVLGEEGADEFDDQTLQRALANDWYIVDPIDGTAPYAHHIPLWGISLGLARCGQLCEGAVYLPATDEMFVSEGGHVYYAEAYRAKQTWQQLSNAPATTELGGLLAVSQDVCKHGCANVKNPVHAVCCAVMPLTYLLLGRYGAYLTTLNLWDVAGALPMLHQLGFRTEFKSGRRLDGYINNDNYVLTDSSRRWRMREPCLFSGPGAGDELWEALRWPAGGDR